MMLSLKDFKDVSFNNEYCEKISGGYTECTGGGFYLNFYEYQKDENGNIIATRNHYKYWDSDINENGCIIRTRYDVVGDWY